MFYLEFSKRESHVVDAVVKNMGLTPAYDVRITLTPELRRFWDGGISDVNPVEEAFSFLPPGEFIADSLGLISNFHEKYPDARFSGEIQYRDRENLAYREAFTLDYNYRKRVGIAIMRKESMSRQLDKIDRRLAELTQAIKGLGSL